MHPYAGLAEKIVVTLKRLGKRMREESVEIGLVAHIVRANYADVDHYLEILEERGVVEKIDGTHVRLKPI